MPILRHWSATISASFGYGRNAAIAITWMRSRSPLSVRSRKPSASFFASPILSSSALACATSSTDHFLRQSGPGLCGMLSPGAGEPGVPTPSQNVSFNWSRSMPSDSARRKSALVSHLRTSGIARETLVHVEHEVGSGKSEIQMDLVVALRLVIEQHRQLAQVDMPLLLVVFPGHRAEVDDLEVLGERELHPVEIRQLIARRIDGVVVRISAPAARSGC